MKFLHATHPHPIHYMCVVCMYLYVLHAPHIQCKVWAGIVSYRCDDAYKWATSFSNRNLPVHLSLSSNARETSTASRAAAPWRFRFHEIKCHSIDIRILKISTFRRTCKFTGEKKKNSVPCQRANWICCWFGYSILFRFVSYLMWNWLERAKITTPK